MRKTKRGREEERYRLPHTLQGVDSLQANGAFVLPLSPRVREDSQLFIQKLDTGTGRWYDRMIDLASAAPTDRPGQGFDAATVQRQQTEYGAAPEAERGAIVQQFNPATDAGRQRLFDPKERKRLTSGASYGEFVRYLVQRAKQGNTPMAQSGLHQGWTETGFGMFAHLVPALGLEVAVEVADQLRDRFGLAAKLPHHFPHVIYKPDQGSELKAHHDQIAPRRLLSELRAHVASDDPSVLGWGRKFGVQLLAHLRGGDTLDAGPTYIIGPMTPARLLLCLEAIADGRVEEAPAEWWNAESGPYFFPWVRALPALNAALEAAGETGDLGILPIMPSAADRAAAGAQADLPFWLGLPVGFPHGSLPNHGARRVTVTQPLDVLSDGEPNPDTMGWLRALGALADPSTPPQELQDAEQLVERRGYMQSFADGLTHRRPSAAAALIRHPAHASNTRRPGWFWEVAPTRSQVEVFLQAFKKGTGSAPSASADPFASEVGREDGARSRDDSDDDPMDNLPLSQLMCAHAVDDAIASRLASVAALQQAGVLEAIRSGELRMLNVRQPWASLLVLGHKTIENRSEGATPPRPKEWVLVVASKSPPKPPVLQEMLRDYKHAIGDDREAARRIHELTSRFGHQWPSQAIVGLVRFARVDAPGTPGLANAPWYHAPDAAWRVDAHHPFAHPVEGIDGTLSIRRLVTLPPNVRARVEHELMGRLS